MPYLQLRALNKFFGCAFNTLEEMYAAYTEPEIERLMLIADAMG